MMATSRLFRLARNLSTASALTLGAGITVATATAGTFSLAAAQPSSSGANEDLKMLDKLILPCKHFPKKGILFHDVFPIFQDPVATEKLVTHLLNHLNTEHEKIDVVVGLDSRGFLLGPILAMRLGCAFVPIRKKGKLPGDVTSIAYQKEYGVDNFEIQTGAVKEGAKVVVVDDLLATGGTMDAAVQLVTRCGGDVIKCLLVVDLPELGGCKKVKAPVYSMFQRPAGC